MRMPKHVSGVAPISAQAQTLLRVLRIDLHEMRHIAPQIYIQLFSASLITPESGPNVLEIMISYGSPSALVNCHGLVLFLIVGANAQLRKQEAEGSREGLQELTTVGHIPLPLQKLQDTRKFRPCIYLSTWATDWLHVLCRPPSLHCPQR